VMAHSCQSIPISIGAKLFMHGLGISDRLQKAVTFCTCTN
jgi:hypothetical protein